MNNICNATIDPLVSTSSIQSIGEVTLPCRTYLKRGGFLDQVVVSYESWGTLNAFKNNTVLIFTGLSPNAHAASNDLNPTEGWWEYLIGPKKPIDTDKYFVICVNSLGSCFGSTGPKSIDPNTGKAYRLNFPELSIEDIADVTALALTQLGLEKIDTVVGPSMGGMVALYFAKQYANRTRRLVSISSSTKASASAIAIRSLQREMICNDPKWNNGNYTLDSQPHDGMLMARKLGLFSYRSGEEWEKRFSHNVSHSPNKHPFSGEFEIESYLEYNAEKFIGQFDPNSYLYLSRAMDWFDITDAKQTLVQSLRDLKTEQNLIIGVENDFLFPIWQQETLSENLKECGLKTDFYRLDSIQGHDAFLTDKPKFSSVIRQFFDL